MVYSRCKSILEQSHAVGVGGAVGGSSQLPPSSSSSSAVSASSPNAAEVVEGPRSSKRRRVKKRKKLSTPSGYAVVSTNGIHEVLVSSKGVLQGTTAASIRSPSLISKESFLQSYLVLIKDENKQKSYYGAKHELNTSYTITKQAFLGHDRLRNWKKGRTSRE
jgi:hypothetical protein